MWKDSPLFTDNGQDTLVFFMKHSSNVLTLGLVNVVAFRLMYTTQDSACCEWCHQGEASGIEC